MGILVKALVLGGGYLAWHTWESKKAIDELEVSLSKFQVYKFKPTYTELKIVLSIHNPRLANLAYVCFYKYLYINKLYCQSGAGENITYNKIKLI